MKYLMLFTLLCLCFTCGCATLANGTTQSVTITTAPPGATVVIDNKVRVVTPANVILSRGSNHNLLFVKSGYKSSYYTIMRRFLPTTAGNFIAGGFLGILVDACSGANYELVPSHVHVVLVPDY